MSRIRPQYTSPMPARVDHQADEPAYGLYLRTCHANGRFRTYTAFARCGITGGQTVGDLDPGRVAHLCKNDFAAVATASPRVTVAGVSLFEESVSRDHFSTVHRRWCPACLDESPHHRVWWDIQYVTACPDHRLKIVETCGCERRPTWKRSHPLRCVAQHDFRDAEREMAGDDEVKLSTYIRDRLLSRDRTEALIVDTLSALGDVLSACDQVGRASFGVDTTLSRLRARLGRGAVAAEGFRILADFPEAFEDLLVRLLGQSEFRRRGNRQWGVEHAYGEFYTWLANINDDSEFTRLLKQSIARHAQDNLTLKSGHKVAGIEVEPAPGIDLTTAAERWGVTFERFRRLATALEILPKKPLRGRPARLDETMVDRWSPIMRAAKTREEVAGELAIAPHVCGLLIRDGILPALIEGKADRENRLNIWLLRGSSAEDLVTALASKVSETDRVDDALASLPITANAIRAPLATLIRLVLDDKLRVRRLDAAEPGLGGVLVSKSEAKVAVRRAKHPEWTVTEAAANLGYHADLMAQLRDRGLAQATKAGRLWLVAHEEVERLRATYVTVAEIALALAGVHRATALAVMRRRRVRPVCDRPEFRQVLYLREAAMRAVSRHLAPKAQPPRFEPAVGPGPWFDCKAAADRLKVDPQLVRQLARAGLLPGRQGADGIVIADEDLNAFSVRHVSLSELATKLGKGRRSFASVKPILDAAGVVPSCSRPEFHAAMYLRRQAVAAIEARSAAQATAKPQVERAAEEVLTAREVQERLGITDYMLTQLRNAGMIDAPARKQVAWHYSEASVARFDSTFVVGARLTTLVEDRAERFDGNALTLLATKLGVAPVCERPEFYSYVFRRDEVTNALRDHFEAEDRATERKEFAAECREGQITLRAFQERLRISSNAGSALVREGLLKADVHASTILVDMSEVNRFEGEFVSAREVATLIGREGANAALKLLSDLRVQPVIAPPAVPMNFFDRAQVEKALSAWRKDPSLAVPVAKRPDDVLLAADIRAALGCPDTLVKQLVESGLVLSRKQGRATVVRRSDFAAFRARYTLASEYKEALACDHAKTVSGKLRRLGVKSISDRYGLCLAVFLRKDVEAAIGNQAPLPTSEEPSELKQRRSTGWDRKRSRWLKPTMTGRRRLRR